MAICSEGHIVTKQLFMWLMAVVYLFAFSSLYTQVPGLYGADGLTPVHNIVPKLNRNVSWVSQFKTFPSLLLFHSRVGLSPSHTMELCCVAGAFLSLLMLVFRAMRCSFTFALLWLLYLSVYKVGQVFLWFQWDSLLLEAGFLTILVAPFNIFFWRKPAASSTDGLSLWLVRFLLFRLMFASGVVKLTSQCPTWWGLTALNYHYETQCIPTPLAWYAHQLPEWVQKLSVVATYVIEVAMPFLFFLPVRSLRLLGFLSQVFLQVLIIATGNYNFFNLITITLSISLIDDKFLGYGSNGRPNISEKLCRMLFGRNGSLVLSAVRFLLFITISGLVLALTIFYFNIKMDYKNLAIQSDVGFTSEGFSRSLAVTVPLVVIIAVLSLSIEIINAFFEALSAPSVFSKFHSLLHTVLFTGVVMTLFSVSLVSHGVLDNRFYKSIPPPISALHSDLDHYSITSPYGLFRRMTGVGGRPEVIVEGTNDHPEGDTWKEYEFLYKPGNINTSPVFVAPHQPRLDWQMWFAALGHYNNNPWLVNLAYKLLIGEEEVLRLLAPPPFSSPPKYIRARLFHYHFSPYDTTRSLWNQTGMWWTREFNSEYLYSLHRDNEKLLEYLEANKYLTQSAKLEFDSPVLPLLLQLREACAALSPPLILWSLFFTGLCMFVTWSLICPDRRSAPLKRAPKVDIAEYLEAMQPPEEEQAAAPAVMKTKRGAYRRHKN